MAREEDFADEAVDIEIDLIDPGPGEDRHDYEPIYLWREGRIAGNSDLGLKLRCRGCGKVIPITGDAFSELYGEYKVKSRHVADFDYPRLLANIPSYPLPDGCGPFDVRAIYDDGSMMVRALGYGEETFYVSRDGEPMEGAGRMGGSA